MSLFPEIDDLLPGSSQFDSHSILTPSEKLHVGLHSTLTSDDSYADVFYVDTPDSTSVNVPGSEIEISAISGSEDLSDSSSALVALKKNYAMNRNAVQARAQRQKKKAYVENLKENCSVLQEQNKALQTTVNEQRAVIDELQGEIAYLRGVFANSNEIASVLRAVKKETGMPLRSSLGKRAGSKPKLHEDEAGPSHGKRLRQRDSSGVCLYIHNQTLSLELCAHCAAKAESSIPSNLSHE